MSSGMEKSHHSNYDEKLHYKNRKKYESKIKQQNGNGKL